MSSPQLFDNCTYGTIAFPCIKNPLTQWIDYKTHKKIQLVLFFQWAKMPVKNQLLSGQNGLWKYFSLLLTNLNVRHFFTLFVRHITLFSEHPLSYGLSLKQNCFYVSLCAENWLVFVCVLWKASCLQIDLGGIKTKAGLISLS